jgi:2-hydroxymuconate-semialdehyde hydrolase
VRLLALDEGEGPPAVLLHGQPGSAGDWRPVIDRLRGRMRVIAPDRPGYGRTGGRAAGFHDNAAALVELLDRLDVESAVVAGHSWATGVALAAAIRFPRRVRALVLAAPVAPGVQPSSFDRLLGHPLVGPPAARIGFGLAGLGLALPPLRKMARAAVPALPPGQVAATAAQWLTGGAWRSFYREQRALLNELPSLEPELSSIDKPATILYGCRDRISTADEARRLAELLPHARLVPIERASHMLPQQRPTLVAEAIAAATDDSWSATPGDRR